MNKRIFYLFVVIIILVVFVCFYWWQRGDALLVQPPSDHQIEQSDDAVDNWQTSVDSENILSFRYPSSLSTQYIAAYDWPPQARLVDESYDCQEAGDETAGAGKTEQRMVDDRQYCRTTIVEGAAGSIYTQYAYAFTHGSSTIVLTFTTRSSQCSNYDKRRQDECENEREAFDIDAVVDRIAQTLIISSGNPE